MSMKYVTEKRFWNTWPFIADRYQFNNGNELRGIETEVCPIVGVAIELGITTLEQVKANELDDEYDLFVKEKGWSETVACAVDFTLSELERSIFLWAKKGPAIEAHHRLLAAGIRPQNAGVDERRQG